MQAGILIVDDEIDVAEEIADGLRADGFAVATAGDGAQALQMIEAAPGRFTVLITDIRMPGMDGITLARRLRALPDASACPEIIFVTGHAVPSEIASAFTPPPIEVARKPFRWAELLTLVSRALERHGSRAGSAA
jgi:CheY-like chemotaxis protein